MPVDEQITLLPTDPTVFAVCEFCNGKVKGLAQPEYFGKAFSVNQWKAVPVCDNCHGPLTQIFRIKPRRPRGVR